MRRAKRRPARESGFNQRIRSQLNGSGFFNLLTVEALDEPVKLIRQINRLALAARPWHSTCFSARSTASRSGWLSTDCRPMFTGSGKRPPNGKAVA